MEQKLKSEGKCVFCENTYDQRGIGRHLDTHLAKMAKENTSTKQTTYCHIEVKAYKMFLHLFVKGNLTMESIDQYLRCIWLECCGHFSGFGYNDQEISMGKRVKNVFQPGVVIFHDYDYGTTTRVILNARNTIT